MRFYNRQHRFYCGIDLHARTMFVVIMDQAGSILLERNVKTDPKVFLSLLAPYREDVVVASPTSAAVSTTSAGAWSNDSPTPPSARASRPT